MTEHAGAFLREWRTRRRISQLELAGRADVSTRHVSFIENGHARPSREMLARLCEHLDVPLRERNRVFLAAGFAPAHPELTLGDPRLAQVNEAIEHILQGHQPWPAVVVDPGWDLVAANDAAYGLIGDVDATLLEPPINVVRLSLDPRGLAGRIVNLPEWRAGLLRRISREHEAAPDERLASLLTDFGPPVHGTTHVPGIVVPMRIRTGEAILSFITTTTVFGTPREVTVSELAIEMFYPADRSTRLALAG